MSVQVTPFDDACGSCGAEENVVALFTFRELPGPAGDLSGAVALCPECLIRAEALLRGARKHGPRVTKWGGR